MTKFETRQKLSAMVWERFQYHLNVTGNEELKSAVRRDIEGEAPGMEMFDDVFDQWWYILYYPTGA